MSPEQETVPPQQAQPSPLPVTPGSIVSKPFYKKPLFYIVLAVIFILGGGFAVGYFIYNKQKLDSIWDLFSKGETGKIFQTKFTFEYSDPNEAPESEFLELKNIKFKLDGSAYINRSIADKPESSSKVQYTFGSGNTSFSTGLEYILLDGVLYLNVGDNPLLSSISRSEMGGKKIDWLKIDIKKVKEEISSLGTFLEEASDPAFKVQLEKIWSDSTLIKQEGSMGEELINNIKTQHFKNSLDKQALVQLANRYADSIFDKIKKSNPDAQTYTKEIDQARLLVKEIFSQLIGKLEIKEFETWVGKKDGKLYKVHLVTNAPSVVSMVKNLEGADFFTTRAKSRDAKRLADIRQMASALELYYNDHNRYPESKDGVPVGNITPNYIGILPQAPTPADGKCSEYYNSYWYEVQPDGQNYTLTFCLGAITGGYPAGLARLTAMGIEGGLVCPGSEDQCEGSNAQSGSEIDEMKSQVKDFISKLDFSAKINVEMTYYDYGKKIELTPPTEFYDILEALGSARAKSRDAKRLADIRQLASANELYFNDKNEYPKTLSVLTPTYIGLLPTPPTPADGSCTEDQNKYIYERTGLQTYKLTFCLGTSTGGYAAGVHTLSHAGIQ